MHSSQTGCLLLWLNKHLGILINGIDIFPFLNYSFSICVKSRSESRNECPGSGNLCFITSNVFVNIRYCHRQSILKFLFWSAQLAVTPADKMTGIFASSNQCIFHKSKQATANLFATPSGLIFKPNAEVRHAFANWSHVNPKVVNPKLSQVESHDCRQFWQR